MMALGHHGFSEPPQEGPRRRLGGLALVFWRPSAVRVVRGVLTAGGARPGLASLGSRHRPKVDAGDGGGDPGIFNEIEVESLFWRPEAQC